MFFLFCVEEKCWQSKYGCCPDHKTLADGPAKAGCGSKSSVTHLYYLSSQWRFPFNKTEGIHHDLLRRQVAPLNEATHEQMRAARASFTVRRS